MDLHSTPASLAPGDERQSVGGDTSAGAGRREGPSWETRILWLAGSALAAVGIGCVAGWLQIQGIAPVALLPLAVGGGVAVVVERWGHALRAPIRRHWVALAVVWALLAIGAEVYIGYWWRLRDLENFEQSHPKAALFADEQRSDVAANLPRYFEGRWRQAPLLLLTDALLTTGAAAGWMEFRRRRATAHAVPKAS